MNYKILSAVFLLLSLYLPKDLYSNSIEKNESTTTELSPDNVTVPLYLKDNIPTIDITLKNAEGSEYTARFLVDTGGGGFIFSEKIARKLGIETGESFTAEGSEFAMPKSVPMAFIDNFELDLNPQRVIVFKGDREFSDQYDGLFPGHILSQYHIIFDYPNETFTIAEPGILDPIGSPMPMPISPMQGFPYTEIKVKGNVYGFLLDTGPAVTILSQAILEKWGTQNPDWERTEGAVGISEALAEAGGQVIETMIVPEGRWGEFKLESFAIASQREGTFEEWMSSMMPKPVVGALAGNVLNQFRLELDYKNELLYISKP